MNDLIKQLLIEELRFKKVFNARFAVLCELCRENIEEDKEFVFIGNSKKICLDCQRAIISELETL